MYIKYFKRIIDFVLAMIGIIVLSPIFLALTIIGLFTMRGNPFFIQYRPGKKNKYGEEIIFKLIKFRTMSNQKDENGKLLPDSLRLNKYGKILRSTSLDELPELFNILKGDMSIVGPRPQLVSDMIFMNAEQRRRHEIRPGLTGYAQVNGRNNITWDQKFEYDLEYLDNGITFRNDIRIIFQTINKVLYRKDVARKGTVSDIDYGEWLLENNKVEKELYEKKQFEAKMLLKNINNK